MKGYKLVKVVNGVRESVLAPEEAKVEYSHLWTHPKPDCGPLCVSRSLEPIKEKLVNPPAPIDELEVWEVIFVPSNETSVYYPKWKASESELWPDTALASRVRLLKKVM